MKKSLKLLLVIAVCIAVMTFLYSRIDTNIKYRFVIPMKIYESHLSGDTIVNIYTSDGNEYISCYKQDFTQLDFVYETVFTERLSESDIRDYIHALEIVYEQKYNHSSALIKFVAIDLLSDEYFYFDDKTSNPGHDFKTDSILFVF